MKRSNYRFTKPHGPEYYKYGVKCPKCKTTDNYSFKKIRDKHYATKAKLCYCYRVPHPHKEGGHVLCIMYPHEHLVMHWPWDHEFTIAREEPLHEYSQSLHEPKNKRHVRTAFK